MHNVLRPASILPVIAALALVGSLIRSDPADCTGLSQASQPRLVVFESFSSPG